METYDDTVKDERLDLEFAYTSYDDSCRDLLSLVHHCRRPAEHDGVHAAGFGAQRMRWVVQSMVDNPDMAVRTIDMPLSPDTE